MTKQLPDTINAADKRYDHLGRALTATTGHVDGAHVARWLHAYFEQDVRDWFYDRLWPYFATIRVDSWSDDESIRAEMDCRTTLSFFQVVRGATASQRRGYIARTQLAWYTHWLLELNFGHMTRQREDDWLSAYNQHDDSGQLALFSLTLSKSLPEVQTAVPLISLYAPTFDFRVKATTAGAFGDDRAAQEFRARAIQVEDTLDEGIRRYLNGGSEGYMLENEQGVLIFCSADGTTLPLWTTSKYAKEMNVTRFGGNYWIAAINYREIEAQLQGMLPMGLKYVAIDYGITGHSTRLDAEPFLKQVQEVISEVEFSQIGKAMRAELER